MGLASKLAAAQGGAAAVANFTGQQGQQQGGSYPGQGQYQAYPGGQSHTIDHTRIDDHMPLASRLAAGGAGAGAPPPSQSPYPAPLQPGRPQNPGYQSPAPGGYPGQSGGYQSPAPGGYPGQQAPYGQPPQQQQYSRPPPPPPGQGGSPYPGAASPYPGQAQPYGQPPQQQQYGQSQGYPSQGPPGGGYGGYGGPPPGQQPSYPPQGQQQGYGAPPPGGQPGYGGGPPADMQTYVRQLEQAIQEKQLQAFYRPGDPRLQGIAQRAAQQVDRLCQAWKIQREIAMDIVRLALYDVVIYIDDSGSMAFEENGERIDDLKLIMQRVAFAATLFDDDGIDIRFMNDDQIPENMLSGVRTEQQIHQILGPKKYKGLTPFGTKLREKVVDGIVLPKLRQPRKPILVIGITDGQPAGESADTLMQTIRYAVGQTQNLGPGAVAFEFAQVGNDQKATEFLAKLDNDPGVGGMVDCTSNYENESAEMSRAQPPVDLTPDLWMLKLILGAIDPSYDTKDEKSNMAGGHPPGPGGYGGPPQYGGAPPQQGYGAPPGPPPGQGGYPGQQQYGAPPGPPPGQGQYGRPPPGPPPGQGGGYGAPPPQYGSGPPRY